MRGTPDRQEAICHTFSVEDLIEPEHPLRPIRRMVDTALAGMSRTFRAVYSDTGRPGVPPETLLKALFLQCLYTIRSERELCRRLKTDLLFRWFLDLQPSDAVFDHSVFTHNRDRLATHGISQRVAQAHMRHTNPRLTASTYTDQKLLPVAGAINALPWLPTEPVGDEAETMLATGTDGAPADAIVDSAQRQAQQPGRKFGQYEAERGTIDDGAGWESGSGNVPWVQDLALPDSKRVSRR